MLTLAMAAEALEELETHTAVSRDRVYVCEREERGEWS